MEILIFDTHQPLSAIIYPFSLCSAIPMKAAFLHGENLWCRVLEANKKQVPLKSYSLEIGINSVNQILKNKEKVKFTNNLSTLITITDWKIPCVYIYVYQIKKVEDLVRMILYVMLITEDIFWVSPKCEIEGKCTCFT